MRGFHKTKFCTPTNKLLSTQKKARENCFPFPVIFLGHRKDDITL